MHVVRNVANWANGRSIGEAPAAGKRIIDKKGSTDYFFLGNESPGAAIQAIGRIVAHGEQGIGWNFQFSLIV